VKSKNRVSLMRISVFLATSPLLLLSLSARAQTVTATVTVGPAPEGVATNTVTNKIYVANYLSSSNIMGGNVTVIDGTTNSTTTVPAGTKPVAVAVNELTNKIYVANMGCSLSGKCTSKGSVTVIDGATNSTTTVSDANANGPRAVAVNPVTNKIYVANYWTGNITVIDGATNSTTTIIDPNANGLAVYAVAVNQVTNKIYVANQGYVFFGTNPGNVTVIDGATNSTTTVTDPNAITPFAVAVNPVTNKIYVANEGAYPATNHGNITVIDGVTNSITTVTDPNALAPLAVAIDSATNKIYVANANDSALTGNGGVTVIDGTTNTISTVRFPNGMFPHGVALDTVTNTIYVTSEGCFAEDSCRNPGSVTVINGATNSVTTIINPNASNPEALALDPVTDKIYVANAGSGNVTVIDGSKTPSDFTVSVIDSGSGAGTVTSNPAGINCPSSCSASFALGTMVGLTASPASGSTFAAWSGACSSVGACNVTTTGFVTATFNSLPPPDFSLSPASATLTLQPGTQKTDAMTLTPQNGPFATAILLTCTVTAGPAPAPTCGLNPASVTPGANSATSTLTITAASTAAMLKPSGHWPLSKPLFALWLPLTLGIMAVGRSKKLRRQCWALGGFLILLLLLQTGCAGGGGGTTITPVNYTVTVRGVSGSIQHTTKVTVTVQ
jgi:DNA-binding beta-propeller fold protein YncE